MLNPFSNAKIEQHEICDECGGAKKLLIKTSSKEFIVPCVCDCKEKELELEELERMQLAKLRREKLAFSETFGNMAYVPSFEERDAKTMENVLEIAKSYCERFPQFLQSGQGLIFYGKPDQGKTWFALCMANELYKRYNVRFVSAADYVDSCNGFDGDDIQYALCDLLILDDLGTQRDTSFGQECIYKLINSRYNAKKPIIVTTNLSTMEMMNPASITDLRIFSRVLEICMPVHVDNGRKRVQQGRYDDLKQALGIS